MGAFKGGEKMKQVLEHMTQQLGSAKSVRVGFLEGSTCGKNNDASAPEVAFYNEYGTISRTQLEGFRSDDVVKEGKTTTKKGRGGRIRVITGRKQRFKATGINHIPPRPFFRIMIQKNSPLWGKLVRAALKMSDYNTRAALNIVGLKMHEQLQKSIEDFVSPGNAPATVAAKGFDKPLEDSKNMKRAIWFEVSE